MKAYILRTLLIVIVVVGVVGIAGRLLTPPSHAARYSRLGDVAVYVRYFLQAKPWEPRSGPLTEEEVRGTLGKFFDSLREQRPLAASLFLSGVFSSPRHRSKQDYVADLNHNARVTRTVEQRAEIRDVLLFPRYALAVVDVDGLRVWNQSGVTDPTRTSRIIAHLQRTPLGVKIINLETEAGTPLASERNGVYEDRWLFYRFRIPEDYVFLRTNVPDVAATASMYHRKKSISLAFAAFWIEQDVPSASWMVANDISGMKGKMQNVTVSESKVYRHGTYDGALLDISFDDQGASRRERRVYFWRKPLMYVLSLQSIAPSFFPDELQTFEKWVDSFNYIDVPEPFRARLTDVNTKTKDHFQNNFFHFGVGIPPDWKIPYYKPNFVQLLPNNDRSNIIATLTAHKTDSALKTAADSESEVLSQAFPYYRLLNRLETGLQGRPAVRMKSRFKDGLLDSYAYKDQLLTVKDGVLYDFALTSRHTDEKTRDRLFDQYFETLSVD